MNTMIAHGVARLLEAMVAVCENRSADCRRDCDHAENSRTRAAASAEWRSWSDVAAALESAPETAAEEGL
jgi:hypothetical protein